MKQHWLLLMIGILAVVLIAGCTTPQVPSETTSEPATDPEPAVPAAAEETADTGVTGATTSTIEWGSSEEETEAGSNADIKILGRSGFDPAELTTYAGEEVVFVNADSEKKAVALTFRLEGTQKMFNSKLIKPGEEYTQLFSNLGTYIYWTEGYGVQGKVVVQE